MKLMVQQPQQSKIARNEIIMRCKDKKIIIKMLNFLHNRNDQVRQSITGINRKPAIAFGMSAETPTQFVKPNTMISGQTYANPHLKYQDLRLSKMTFHQKSKVNGDWIHKTNLNLVEEEKVVNIFGTSRNRSFYHDMYMDQFRKGSSRFRLTKGQFTTFLHNQHKNQILGPLQGQQRTLQRARQTKKSIMQQSISSLQKLKRYISHYKSNPSLLSTQRTSTLWNEKRNLRKSREALHKSIKVELENRRYNKSPDFLLPKVIKASLKKNTHRPTQSETLCQNYLSDYYRTIDTVGTGR